MSLQARALHEKPERSTLLAAESIFESMQSGKAEPLPSNTNAVPSGRPESIVKTSLDVSKVEVEDNQIDELLAIAGFETPLRESKKVVEKPKNVEQNKPQELGAKLESLMRGMLKILEEFRDVTNEMTSVGMIGTGTAKPLGKKTKYGRSKLNKGIKNNSRSGK